MRRHKPAALQVGCAYRLWKPFCAGPSGDVVLVVAIGERVGKSHHRSVEIEFISYDWLDEHWRFYSYADLFKRVHSEAPLAIH